MLQPTCNGAGTGTGNEAANRQRGVWGIAHALSNGRSHSVNTGARLTWMGVGAVSIASVHAIVARSIEMAKPSRRGMFHKPVQRRITRLRPGAIRNSSETDRHLPLDNLDRGGRTYILFCSGSAELGERGMPENERDREQAIRERAYLIWESEGRPEGRADDHWRFASFDYPPWRARTR